MEPEMEQQWDQSIPFIKLMQDITHEWGFVVVNTTNSDEEEEQQGQQQWSDALSNLRNHVLASQGPDAEMDPDTLALPVLHLPGASIPTVRLAFNSWLRAYDADGDNEWGSDVRRDVFVVVDAPAMRSLLAVGHGEDAAWVVIVDVDFGNTAPAPRPDYPGWMRCLTRALGTLSEDLDADRGLESLCPVRQYADQVPLFDGSPKGKLLEPAGQGGIEGPRVGFSRGTQRGFAAGGTQRGV